MQRGSEYIRLKHYPCFWPSIFFVDFVIVWVSVWASFWTDENLEWWSEEDLSFFLPFLPPFDVFMDLGERPVNRDSGVIASLTVISSLMSCLYLASLVTAFSVRWLMMRATGTVKVCDFLRLRTRACMTFWVCKCCPRVTYRHFRWRKHSRRPAP